MKNKDHPDWCEICYLVGGYCGMCGGSFWNHKNWVMIENSWQPQEDWKEELITRACNGDEEAILMLDQI